MDNNRNSSMEERQKKPRILCLHGFRTSAEILKKLITRWPDTIIEKLDLVFLDGPFPAQGKSDVEGIFDPPYYEWFQSDKPHQRRRTALEESIYLPHDLREFYNFEECLEYMEDYMVKHGPFDGVLGFSQGAILAASLPGMQREEVALTKVPKLKFIILISGARFGERKFGIPNLAANAFSSSIICPSLQFIGETDFMKEESEALLQWFVDPVVIRHSKGHTIPRIDDDGEREMLGFLEKIEELL